MDVDNFDTDEEDEAVIKANDAKIKLFPANNHESDGENEEDESNDQDGKKEKEDEDDDEMDAIESDDEYYICNGCDDKYLKLKDDDFKLCTRCVLDNRRALKEVKQSGAAELEEKELPEENFNSGLDHDKIECQNESDVEAEIEILWKCDCNFYNHDVEQYCHGCNQQRKDMPPWNDDDKIMFKVKNEYDFEPFEIYAPGHWYYGEHLIVGTSITISSVLDHRIEPYVLRPIYHLFVDPQKPETKLRAATLKTFKLVCILFYLIIKHTLVIILYYETK